MPIRTKRIYDPPAPEDGTRILVMRLYPRGLRRAAFHEWRKELGTDVKLIKAFKAGRLAWPEFARRFRRQIRDDPAARATLDELRRRARSETLTLLCACEMEARCHRGLLRAMLTR